MCVNPVSLPQNRPNMSLSLMSGSSECSGSFFVSKHKGKGVQERNTVSHVEHKHNKKKEVISLVLDLCSIIEILHQVRHVVVTGFLIVQCGEDVLLTQ